MCSCETFHIHHSGHCSFQGWYTIHAQEHKTGTQRDSRFPLLFLALQFLYIVCTQERKKQQLPTVLDLKAFNDIAYI